MLLEKPQSVVRDQNYHEMFLYEKLKRKSRRQILRSDTLSCLEQVGPTDPRKFLAQSTHWTLMHLREFVFCLVYWMFDGSFSPSSKLESWGLLTNFRTCLTDHSRLSIVSYVLNNLPLVSKRLDICTQCDKKFHLLHSTFCKVD